MNREKSLRYAGKKVIDCLCFFIILPSYLRQRKGIEEKKIKKILLINLQGIGDVLMTTQLLSALREKFLKAEINYLCYNGNGALLENDKRINHLIKRKEDNLVSIDFLKTVNVIQKSKYDLVINLYPAQHSALLTAVSNAEYKLGHLYNTAAVSNNLAVRNGEKTWDVRENCQNIAEQLGIKIENPYNIEIEENRKIRKQVKEFFGRNKYIVLNTEANWIAKQWPIEQWKGLVIKLMQEKKYKQYKIAFIGTEKEKEKIDRIIKDLQETTRVENWAGRWSLKELVSVLKYATLFISTDTGPMHIAIAVKTKIIALFGCTDPDILVKGAKKITVLSTYNQCPKKGRFNHNNEPPKEAQEMMKRITIEQVLQAVEKNLK